MPDGTLKSSYSLTDYGVMLAGGLTVAVVDCVGWLVLVSFALKSISKCCDPGNIQ